MKNIFLVNLIFLFAATFCIFAQEEKAVIGFGEVTTSIIDYEARSAAQKIQSYLSSALVNSNRFRVVARSTEEINKLSEESMMQNQSLASLQDLDFLLISKVVDFAKKNQKVSVMGVDTFTEVVTLGLEVKFIDVSTGRIVISETLRDKINGNTSVFIHSSMEDKNATGGSGKITDLIAVATEKLSNEVVAKIIDKLYPSLVLSVSKNGVIMVPNLNYQEGNVIDIFKLGEEIIDPYTLQPIGQEETLTAKAIVFEINNGIAKIMIDPVNVKFKKAVIEKGMLIRKSTDKDVTKVTVNKLKRLSAKK
ncbi:MAG: hypothetical protein J1G30_01900 [Spirochaetales bacterium]|nr:hypothetical protein [Spirochaetales bacterium]